MTLPTIRPAAAADAPAVAVLLAQLGYPASFEQVVERLENLRTFHDAIALVASRDGSVIGVVTGHLIRSIHATPVIALLTTLVVADGCQRSGVGTRLVAAVEDWARDHGAVRISVTSGTHREGAHAFYKRIGYEPTGLRLGKDLT